MKTVIAEKPSVAKEIAKIVGATEKKDGYFEGNNYYVTWAFGHLAELKDFKSLGFETWDINLLPFIPKNIELKLKEDKGAIVQFKKIKDLFEKSNSIICATDAGREGELIFRYIYQYAKSNKIFQRLWISSLTDEALKNGFDNLKNGTDYDNLFYAARARNEADYLIGINATIGMTAKANVGLLSLGRVQTPTLGLICNRFLDNSNFIAKAYYTASLLVQDENKNKFILNFENNFDTKDAATLISSNIDNLLLSNIIEKEIKESPPILFDLTLLQREANNQFGYSAQFTLDTAQSLYETHKILSYPRTSSNYLSSDMYAIIPNLMKKISAFHENKNSIEILLNNEISKKPINDKKITDHHAIIPTDEKPNLEKLSIDEKNIYLLVVDRFIEAFMEDCYKNSIKYEFKITEGNFFASSISIIRGGWRALKNENEISEEEVIQILPILKVGDKVEIIEKHTLEKFTKPLPILTESTLLRLMETAGKLVENASMRDIMKEGGLGTPATRAAMIETLINRTYIYRNKKQLLPTEKGLQLFEYVKDMQISKPDLTANWETKLALIEKGEYLEQDFKNEIIASTYQIIESIKNMDTTKFNKTIGTCPKCQEPVLDFGKNYKCSSVTNCQFPPIWKTIGSKNIESKVAEQLLSKGKTEILKGFENKDGKKFDAAIIYDATNNCFVYDFTKEVVADCPKCKTGKIEKGPTFFKCNDNENCDFIIWQTISSKKIPDAEILKLIKNYKTSLIKGFVSKVGKPFDAYLILKNGFKTEFEFPVKK